MKERIYISFFISVLLGFLLTSCEKIDETSTPEDYSSPVIRLIDITPVKINTDSININNGKNPDDSVQLNISFLLTENIFSDQSYLIQRFEYTLFNSMNSLNQLTGTIKTSKSAIEGNTGFKHSGLITFAIKRKDIGNYSLRIFGFDSKERKSNLIISNINVFRENHPPIIEKVSAPDTIFISEGTQKHFLIAKVSDPEGLNDIKKVYFNSFKPDGSAASGNPFQLLDDGNKLGASGDDKAGDGQYSLTIQITDQNPKGKYRFDFYATDKSDSTSNSKTHYIVVK